MIKRLATSSEAFDLELSNLLKIDNGEEEQVRTVVREILGKVRSNGDSAILEYTSKFDALSVSDVSELRVEKDRLEKAYFDLDPLVKEALETSVNRVRHYHQMQKKALGGGTDWSYKDAEGNQLGQLVRGMDRIGIYAPGGKAAYPSTVVMTAIPARVAGVSDITLMVPTPGGQANDVLLAAAHLCGVDRMYTIGGAQAIAALTYGTQTISKVDKIVGPGNIYVATAKELVFGDVGIDMVAGPSEVAIVADNSADVDWLVMDMFAQAEHDELAQSILISVDEELLDAVEARIELSINQMQRKSIIQQSLAQRGALIKVEDLDEAIDIVNRIAPEHLELAIDNPEKILGSIRFAGAVFMGKHSAEVVGDYTAGPSHVLPTNGAARFASPLGVYDFQIRSSLINCSPRGAVKLSRAAAILAQEEGLFAHAESAKYRVQG